MAGRTRLARSKNVASGGKGKGAGNLTDALGPAYAGGGSNVAAAAHKRARGGRVPGKKMMPRMDKRARGGRVGANKSPFSTAANPTPKSQS